MLKKSILIFTLLMMVFTGANAQETIPIGAIFDLSGISSETGRPYAEGIAAYIEFVNANGGINGRAISMPAGDFGGSAANVEQIYAQLTAQGIVMLLGWDIPDSEVLTRLASRDQIPMLTAAYSDIFNDPYNTAPYSFVTAPTYSDQIEMLMTQFAAQWANQGGQTADMSVAVFYDDSDFGADPLNRAAETVSAQRIGGLLRVKIPRGATDFTAELQQADDYGVTHIIIQSNPQTAAALARNVESFFGNGAVQIGCLSGCADEQFIARAGSAAEGALGVLPFAPLSLDLAGHDAIRDFAAARGIAANNLSVHFVQGWTTASIAVEAIRQTLNSGAALSGANIRATLESFDEFETGGLIQPITFSAEDHIGTRASVVYVVSGGQWIEASNIIDLR